MGALSFTVTVKANVLEPAALMAVTVYWLAADVLDGVPEMMPVVVLSDRPAGNVGDTLNSDGAPPDITGAFCVTAMFLVYTAGEVE